MKPINDKLTFTVQKNKKVASSSIITLVDAKNFPSLFSKAENEDCEISGWYISTIKTIEQINEKDFMALRMM
jgi:hypothetical protein